MKRCPRNLSKCDSPCSLGLLGVDTGFQEGCEWGINCASSMYCFFNYRSDVAHTDKEISRLLGIGTAAVHQAAISAITKLSEDSGISEIKVLLGEVLRSEGVDESIYDSDTDEKHVYSRHKGDAGGNFLHENGKPQIYALSPEWRKHVDKSRYRSSTRDHKK